MTAQRIYSALLEYDPATVTGREAARAGFLEWVFSLPCGCNARAEARRAVSYLEPVPAGGSAAGLFLGYLKEAQDSAPVIAKRKGGARARRTVH